MKKILRNVALASAVAGSLGLGTTPANAAGGGVFSGTANINCFGCGVSTGTAALCVHLEAEVPPVPPNVHEEIGLGYPCTPEDPDLGTGAPNTSASYSVFEPAGATCVATGTANGTTTGAVNVTFNWTRVGATAVISTTGDIDGAGTAAFKVTRPVGLPCGGPVEAFVVGAVIGT